jgi:hypothetical protein
MKVHPDGWPTTLIFAGIAGGRAKAIAVAANGRIFITVAIAGKWYLAVISAEGVQQALHPLPVWIGNTNLAVVAKGQTVLLYSAAGVPLRTVATDPRGISQAAWQNGTVWLAIPLDAICQTELRRIQFATGVETAAPLRLPDGFILSSLIPGTATAEANVPAAGGAALALLALALAAAGALVLRLR